MHRTRAPNSHYGIDEVEGNRPCRYSHTNWVTMTNAIESYDFQFFVEFYKEWTMECETNVQIFDGQKKYTGR